jgi:hypothetical protein
MTVFVAHAQADQAAAEALEIFLERRGLFVERDDGQTAMRPVQPSDVLVLLLSEKFVFDLGRLRLEQRALDAWSQNRLIVIKLDHAIAPVGLRDLPAIDASFEAQRELKWQEAAESIRAHLRPARREEGDTAGEGGAPPTRTRGFGVWGVIGACVLALPGIAVAALLASIWLVNRIGPRPGGITELRAGADAFGARFGLAPLTTEIISAVALCVTLAVFVFFIARLLTPSPKQAVRAAPKPASASEPAVAASAVFVSYARANSAMVMPVIEGPAHNGRKFWLDRQGIEAGDSWAGEIVRAIRGAASVVVMCSKAAFESDHVKREIYLADRYQKRLVPVFLEEVTPPEDFEYFFAGVQFLKLFEMPEGERPEALARALGASA